MRFSGEIDDRARLVLGEQRADPREIADVAMHEDVARIAREAREVLKVARIGELVEVDDRLVGLRQPVENEVATDETGAAGDENGHDAFLCMKTPLSRFCVASAIPITMRLAGAAAPVSAAAISPTIAVRGYDSAGWAIIRRLLPEQSPRSSGDVAGDRHRNDG